METRTQRTPTRARILVNQVSYSPGHDVLWFGGVIFIFSDFISGYIILPVEGKEREGIRLAMEKWALHTKALFL